MIARAKSQNKYNKSYSKTKAANFKVFDQFIE